MSRFSIHEHYLRAQRVIAVSSGKAITVSLQNIERMQADLPSLIGESSSYLISAVAWTRPNFLCGEKRFLEVAQECARVVGRIENFVRLSVEKPYMTPGSKLAPRLIPAYPEFTKDSVLIPSDTRSSALSLSAHTKLVEWKFPDVPESDWAPNGTYYGISAVPGGKDIVLPPDRSSFSIFRQVRNHPTDFIPHTAPVLEYAAFGGGPSIIAAMACLIVFNQRFPGKIGINTLSKDQHLWLDSMRLCQTVLGYGLDFEAGSTYAKYEEDIRKWAHKTIAEEADRNRFITNWLR